MIVRVLKAMCLTCLFAGVLTWQTAWASVEFSGSWYDPTHDGEGFVVQYIDDDRAVIYWFTYTETGKQRWFIGIGEATENGLYVMELLQPIGGMFGPSFDPADVVRETVGELTLTFNSDSEGLAEYTIGGVDGQQSLVRLTRPVESQGVSSRSSEVPGKSGSWYDPTHDGEGFAIEYLLNGIQVVYWFTYTRDGEQAWMIAVGTSDPSQGSIALDMLKPIGGMFGPNFDPDDVMQLPAGSARLGLACDDAYSTFDASDTQAFTDIDLDLQRLVGIGQTGCSDPSLTNLHPIIGGAAEVPDHEAGAQLAWLFERFADNAPFTADDLEAHFAPEFIATIGTEASLANLEANRAAFPSPRWIDPVNTSPMRLTGIMQGSNNQDAFFVLDVRLSDGLITNISIGPYGSGGNGTTMYADDAVLSLEQAADKFNAQYSLGSVLVARISEAGQCQVVTGRNENVLRSTGSIFKIWTLAGLADALEDRALFYDDIIPLDATKQVRGGNLWSEPPGLPLSVDRLATLMMGVSDNTATDMVLALAGRERTESLLGEYGHSQPEVMTPKLGVSEQFHLFQSFPETEARMYVDGSESFRRDFLEQKIIPLGSANTGGGGFFNESLFFDGAWLASPMDICGAFARLRQLTPGTDAQLVVERAMQAGAAQPNLRERWDRVWYKGGSLDSPFNGTVVLTHAWMLENEGERPVVVIGMANNPGEAVDGFRNQSILGRLLDLAAGFDP